MSAFHLQLEMILQAHEYESTQGMRLQEFFDSTADKWRTNLGRTWAAEIVSRREKEQAAAARNGSGNGSGCSKGNYTAPQ